MLNILIVIPARGGSKGIPRKNLRFINNKPLISWIIDTAKRISYADVVVSTEDSDIKKVASIFSVPVIKRPKYLSEDNVPLDPVIIHALKVAEKQKEKIYDVVITLQPTTPLLKVETLKKAIAYFNKKNIDTLISCIEKRHLFWIRDNQGKYNPFYKERQNRQLLSPIFEETGSFLICRRETLIKGSRIGKKVDMFPIGFEESVDIDNCIDWITAESLIKRRKIVFRVDGNRNIGLGHVYRCLTISNRLIAHQVYFLMNKKHTLGIKKVKEYNYKIILYSDENNFFQKIDLLKPHIIINDILDTSAEYMKKINSRKIFSVNFEDLGEGSEKCNVLFNALYEWSERPKNNKYFGYKYECLREEFYLFNYKRTTKDKVINILISFGGTDLNNLTIKVLSTLVRLEFKGKINVILGLGYKYKNKLEKYVTQKNLQGFDINIIENTKFIVQYINESDIGITSNGRTVYEFVSLGIPVITISQNYRETTHLFSKICPGLINIGIASELKGEYLENNISKLLNDKRYRLSLVNKLVPFAKDIRKGINGIILIIFEKYWEFQDGE